MKRFAKWCLVAAMGATTFGLLDCINLQQLARDTAIYLASEWVLDNNAGPLGNVDPFVDS